MQDLLARRKPRRALRRNADEQDGTYSGFPDCSECGSPMFTHPASYFRDGRCRGYAAYCCRNSTCSRSFTSARLADPQLDQQLEARLGSVEALTAILGAALQDGDRRAVGSIRANERRLVEIENEIHRLGMLFVKGTLSEEKLDKAVAVLKAEEAAVQRLLAEATADQPAVTPELIAKRAEVFGSWPILRREENRTLLREFGARIVVGRVRKRELLVREVRLASLDGRLTLKKMKRFGID